MDLQHWRVEYNFLVKGILVGNRHCNGIDVQPSFTLFVNLAPVWHNLCHMANSALTALQKVTFSDSMTLAKGRDPPRVTALIVGPLTLALGFLPWTLYSPPMQVPRLAWFVDPPGPAS